MVEISVIISVFEEKNVRQCLDSVLNQTFEDVEIICIVDEAVPHLLWIVKEYAKKYDLTIITHRNMTIYETRNIGIDYANGEYILFVNSTDWIDADCLKQLFINATSNDSDFVIYNYIEHEKEKTLDKIYLKTEKNIDYNHYTFNHYYDKKLLLNNIFLFNSKFYKTSFLKDNNIKFDFQDIAEDIKSHVKIMLSSKKISYLPKKLYHYNKLFEEDIQNHNLKFNKHLIIFEVFSAVQILLSENNIYEYFNLEFNEFKLYQSRKYFNNSPIELKEDFYNHLRTEFINWKLTSNILKEMPFELYRFYNLILTFESYNKFENFIKNLNTNLKYIDKKEISKEIENFETDDMNSTAIIVSMTSYPERMSDIHFTIYSLLNQTYKPNKVILWLATEQFPQHEKDIPKNVLNLKKYGLVIKWCEDIKSYKKLIPSLKEYPNQYIVTADDDIYYHRNWLENIWKQHKKYPNTIISSRSRKIIFDENNDFCKYGQWKLSTHEEKPSYLNFPTNGAGTLFCSELLSEEVFNQELFMEICATSDDIWFWAMMVLNKTKISVVENPMNEITYVNIARELNILNQSTLWETNKVGKNDTNLDTLLKQFPEIKRIINNAQND